ncbi:hypothetical protein L226DRAFT_197644 [Lentinus tigrinus ALCF2SS1-7]|uniref:uncharacterized protein n=1 Tax=Lentinus tigrinus ALCF2SS1-7 TaxID=1328758 RepID=UPI001165DE28|nr:hypothetical protein L226DRAFT_197644 [Lentinus tigrinus ALCF2SS1-7]
MSVLAHLLRPAAGARRAYSVFSKPGGGGYFNSSKSPKVAPPSSKSKVDSSSSTTADASSSSPKDDSATMSSGGASTDAAGSHNPSPSVLTFSSQFAPVHPKFSPQDFKLHQFFSLHRPLLTISQHPLSVFESFPSPFSTPATTALETANFGTLEEHTEIIPDADADAARQLARAMVVNRIGASMAWEDTLKRLGLDETSGRAEEVSLAEAEFEIYMDSTKRKRRKKMKKHKLKKRRRVCIHRTFHLL